MPHTRCFTATAFPFLGETHGGTFPQKFPQTPSKTFNLGLNGYSLCKSGVPNMEIQIQNPETVCKTADMRMI